MQLLLNTVMLEVNRWTQDHQLTAPLIDLLPGIKRAGFNALEVWQYHLSRLDRTELDALIRTLGELEMRVDVVGIYPLLHQTGPEGDAAAALAERIMDYTALLGAKVAKVFAGRVPSAQADEACRARSIEGLRTLAEQAARHGMEMTAETHGNTLADTTESTLQLLDELSDISSFGICYQPYTFKDTRTALAEYDAVAHAVRHVHLQNRNDDGNCRLPDGWLDYRRLLTHIKQVGFIGPLSLEFTAGLFPPEGEPFDVQIILDNAEKDRVFVEEVWEGQA